jgi:hypothetical protein
MMYRIIKNFDTNMENIGLSFRETMNSIYIIKQNEILEIKPFLLNKPHFATKI